ncbi:hypothetical protein SISNIDRAFT_471082 [Sistotremastrum niveocremeum HHB9708]|uniref:WD40 repeat-like protein n=1 Tax=Sistotremastrum niveocremeum HHB9708 TaxID=1314777 RepID=A0A164N3Z3_9AGAM|nr:hypothetical protein SISNIDRAFT_471082 [Sistotremastrum niveocremeum HHB9708]
MPVEWLQSLADPNPQPVRCLSICPALRYVASGGDDEVSVRDIVNSQDVPNVMQTGSAVLCISWLLTAVHGWAIVCGLENGKLLTLAYNKESSAVEVDSCKVHNSGVNALSPYLHGHRIVTGGKSDGCSLWIDRGRHAEDRWKKSFDILKPVNGKFPPILRIELISARSNLLIAFKSGIIMCFGLDEDVFLWEINLKSPIAALAISLESESLHLAFIGRNNELRYHRSDRVESRQELKTCLISIRDERLEGPIAFLSHELLLLGNQEKRNSSVLNLATGTVVEHLNHEAVTTLAGGHVHAVATRRDVKSSTTHMVDIARLDGTNIMRSWICRPIRFRPHQHTSSSPLFTELEEAEYSIPDAEQSTPHA